MRPRAASVSGLKLLVYEPDGEQVVSSARSEAPSDQRGHCDAKQNEVFAEKEPAEGNA